MQIFGGLGMSKDLPLERWYRERRIRRIGEGPSEVQRIVMARRDPRSCGAAADGKIGALPA